MKNRHFLHLSLHIFFCLCITTVFADSDFFLLNRIPSENMRYESFLKVLDLLTERNAITLVETGTARCGDKNFKGDGGSTIIFGHWAHAHDSIFYSVDINSKNLLMAKESCFMYPNILFMCEDSIQFLEKFSAKIDFLYLDSFDYEYDNPLPSQQHHLKEIKAAYPHLHDQSVVMIDDCNIAGGGKGGLVVEFLLNHGWKIIQNSYQVIMVKT